MKQTSIVVTCVLLLSASLASVWAQPAGPRILKSYRDRVGQTFQFQVEGRTSGKVWGTGIYTDDSDLATAAVHAGVLRAGQSGVVTVKILPGQDQYKSSEANGVTSRSYKSWPGSFHFVGKAGEAISAIPTGPRMLKSYRDRVGQTFQFQVEGRTSGKVWGTGIYTDDSDLATAAVHAGVLRAGQSGVVTVKILPGQDQYRSSEANGVTSRTYKSWPGSFQFVGTAGEATPTGSGVGLTGKVLHPRGEVTTVYVGRGFTQSLRGTGPFLEYVTMAAKVETDRDGNWSANVPAGTYDVYMIRKGYVPHLWRAVVAPAQIPDTSLEPGMSVHHKSLTLQQRGDR